MLPKESFDSDFAANSNSPSTQDFISERIIIYVKLEELFRVFNYLTEGSRGYNEGEGANLSNS
jgi:hypothetical protein